jgi:heat shock protein HslJ
MRNTVIFSALLILMLSSFNDKKSLTSPYQNKIGILTLDTHKWWLTTIYRTDGYTQVLNRKAFINFNTTGGKIGGNGSCNSFGGSLAVDGNNISVDNIFSTKMYCDAVQSIEDDFFKQLQKVTRYQIKGNKLLLFEKDTLLLELETE